LPANDLENEISFELTVNENRYVLKYSNDSDKFTMNNISLQFETLNNKELQNRILNELHYGFSFLFHHVQHLSWQKIKKKETHFTVDVNVERKSLKGILLLFQNEFDAGERDSEEFPNPKITCINFTIGTPGTVYSKGFKMLYQWDEICRHYVNEEFKNGHHSYINISKNYGDNKFALWVDVRATKDNDLHGVGKQQQSNQEIKMEKDKINGADGEYMMHIFIVSDAKIVMKNKKFGDLEL